ncbi:MAG: serine hydrolase [Neomegalonema sp.]|nr:serine hydrolase [Neomegalonema sp.]
MGRLFGRYWVACGAVMMLSAVIAMSSASAQQLTRLDPRPEKARGAGEAIWAANKRALPKGAKMLPVTRARNAIVIDITSNRVLGVKAPSRAIPPASMTKMMTALMVFEALDRGEVRLSDRVRVSKKAARAPGSTFGLRAQDRPTVKQLLRGLITASGNDAAIALAEALGGSEDAFAAKMTARARRLGFKSAQFRNASGLPAAGHRISVRDLAKLAAYLVARHPKRFHFFGERSVRYRGVRRRNRNPALFLDLSDLKARADGVKTGYTSVAGYCVAATAVVSTRAGRRRVVVVLAGLRTVGQRRRETRKLLRWAARQVRRQPHRARISAAPRRERPVMRLRKAGPGADAVRRWRRRAFGE